MFAIEVSLDLMLYLASDAEFYLDGLKSTVKVKPRTCLLLMDLQFPPAKRFSFFKKNNILSILCLGVFLLFAKDLQTLFLKLFFFF